MDMNSMMQNPMAQQLMSSFASDPELMQLIQRPGMFEKLSALMQNPANAIQYASDPDVQLLMSKVQALQGGGGGGAGARGGFGSGAASSTSSSGGIVSIHSKSQFDQAIASAGDKLVAVDFTASWCGPCKIIAPVFAELASTYHESVVFLKVDGDENRDWIIEHAVTAFPTFHFFVKGNKIASFSGADQNRLRSIVEQYGSASEEAPPCPYVHFPLKDTEIVKYADIEWNPVESKLLEYNQKLLTTTSAQTALDEKENAELNVILQKLQNKSSYHQSSFTIAQYTVINKLLQWPIEYIGPVLNLFRLFILHPHAAQTYAKAVTEKKAGTIDGVSQLLVIAKTSDKPVSALLAIRCLCNFFSRHVSQLSMGARTEDVIDILAPLFKRYASNQSVRASVIALIINYSILFTKDHTHYAAGKVQVLSSITEILTENTDLDAVMLYRIYVIIGTLVYGDESTREMATDMELPATITASAKAFMTDDKVSAVVRELNMAMIESYKNKKK